MSKERPGLRFDNALLRDLPGDPELRGFTRQVPGAAWSLVTPQAVTDPRVLAYSREMAQTLGFSAADVAEPWFAQVFSGNALLPGMQTYATNYGGHQFGHWAGQLGDGRAIFLGESLDHAGQRWEWQLKGAGVTPYSRGADGRAVLRSSIREFLCSEAMHHLGVPSTRALSLVGTGDAVLRDMFYDGHPELEPGAIVCRVAPSFLRFGHFQLPYVRGEIDLLRQLADFCIARDFPWITSGPMKYADWFIDICERTAQMVAHWMRVGFVHGVMNTDNMSVLGLTIDYGPYGWVDSYDPDFTPNTTDAQGKRYRFGWQPRVAHWNLAQLAQALSPLFDDPQPLQAGLQRYAQRYAACELAFAAAKLGIAEDDHALQLMRQAQRLLHAGEIDMTLFFRLLADVDPQVPDADAMHVLQPALYDQARRDAVQNDLVRWLSAWRIRVIAEAVPDQIRRAGMNAVNPLYVPRNYLVQEIIEAAYAGDTAPISRILDILRHPYREQPGREHYAAKRPDWARERPGCSMLSCSS